MERANAGNALQPSVKCASDAAAASSVNQPHFRPVGQQGGIDDDIDSRESLVDRQAVQINLVARADAPSLIGC